MQLDNTQIAVRERGILETFDLALHVLREYWKPCLGYSLLMMVPLAIINYFLIGWMAEVDYEDFEALGFVRFMWSMGLLIFLQAPLASIFVTAFLGPAVFMQKPTFRQVMLDVLRNALPLALCHLILRGVLPAMILLALANHYAFDPAIEAFLVPCIAIYAAGFRALRPYINEIILLEKNPLHSRNPNVITINKRSMHLHGPSGSDLFIRWLVGGLIGLFLANALYGMLHLAIMLLISKNQLSWYHVQFVYPLTLWTIVGFFSVVRFLDYLDLRIRHEGWEVELLMRAEAIRMAGKIW